MSAIHFGQIKGQPVSTEPITVIKFTAECGKCNHQSSIVLPLPVPQDDGWRFFRCDKCRDTFVAQFEFD